MISSYYHPGSGLPRYRRAVAEKRAINVTYFGASNTAMSNSWRDVLAARIDSDTGGRGRNRHDNKALGASNTALACGIPQVFFEGPKPDLVFIEYSAGDALSHLVGKTDLVAMGQSAAERFLRRVLQMAPDADIVFVHMFLGEHGIPGQQDWEAPPMLEYYMRLAEHYGCPSINVSRYLYDLVDSGKHAFTDRKSGSELFRHDGRHMSLLGSEVAATYIGDVIDEVCRSTADGVDAQARPIAPLLDDDYIFSHRAVLEPEFLFGDAKLFYGRALGTAVPERLEFWRLGCADRAEFELRGTLAGITVITNFRSGVLRVEIDGEVRHLTSFRRQHHHVAIASFLPVELLPFEDRLRWRRVRISVAEAVPEDLAIFDATFVPPRGEPESWELNLVGLNIDGEVRPVDGGVQSAAAGVRAQVFRSRVRYLAATPYRYLRNEITHRLTGSLKDRIYAAWAALYKD